MLFSPSRATPVRVARGESQHGDLNTEAVDRRGARDDAPLDRQLAASLNAITAVPALGLVRKLVTEPQTG